jgi:hypothetical protein
MRTASQYPSGGVVVIVACTPESAARNCIQNKPATRVGSGSGDVVLF